MLAKITIITVTYNCASIVEDTIQSIVHQDYPNIEWIIVDGASTDTTIKTFKKYNNHIDQFISEPDKGIYDAMNKGIELATGDFIHFMNAGDRFVSHQSISNIFMDESIFAHDVIFGDAVAKFEGFTKVFKGVFPSKEHIMNFNHQAAFVKSFLMKKYKFNMKYKICADRNFFTAIYLNEKVSYKYIPAQIAVIEAMGFSSSNSFKSRKEDLDIKIDHNLISKTTYEKQILKSKILYFIKSLFPKRLLDLYYKKLT